MIKDITIDYLIKELKRFKKSTVYMQFYYIINLIRDKLFCIGP